MRKLPLVSEARYYVSLGDAQSRNLADGSPGVASRLHVHLARRDPGLKMIPLATEGATAATVRFVHLPRLREMEITPAVVTLTLGASDLPRLASGDASAVCRELTEHGSAVLAALRTNAPLAHILCATLYDPMDGADNVLASGTRQFNDTLRTLAGLFDAAIAETAAAFDGHGSRAGDPLSPPGVVIPDLYLYAGAEMLPLPNGQGADVMARMLAERFYAGLTEETPLVSERTTGGAPL